MWLIIVLGVIVSLALLGEIVGDAFRLMLFYLVFT